MLKPSFDCVISSVEDATGSSGELSRTDRAQRVEGVARRA